MSEGREINFWPPRIGPRLENKQPERGKQKPDNEIESKEPEKNIHIKQEPKLITRHADLPRKSHFRLWGRENEVEKIMAILHDPKSKRVISVSGLGGIGKTALVREIVSRCQQKKLYNEIIWDTAKEEEFIGGAIRSLTPSTLSRDSLLNKIAVQLGHPEIAKETEVKQKEAEVRHLLESLKCLIVVDNLEAVEDHKMLVPSLAALATSISPFILTSRIQLAEYDEIYCMSLGGLKDSDALSFIRYEGKERGILAIVQAQDESLCSIYEATGGAPLAIKLVIGQTSRLPLETILHDLQKIKGDMEAMYAFMYRTTWKLLSAHARKVLIVMPVFSLSASRTAIEYVSTVKGDDLTFALAELVATSMLDVSDHLLDSQKRYTIHPLTSNFVKTDLAQKWM